MKSKLPPKYIADEIQLDNPGTSLHSLMLLKALLSFVRAHGNRTVVIRDETAAHWAGCKLEDLRACQYRLILAGLMKVRQGNQTARYHLFSTLDSDSHMKVKPAVEPTCTK